MAFLIIAAVAQADTIHLKNGSVLKGKVTSFADDQFTVMIDTGSGRYLSRATVYVGDVARVEFDSVAGGTSAASEPAIRDAAPAEPERQPAAQPSEVKTSSATEQPTRPAEQVDPPVQPVKEEPKETPRESSPLEPPKTSSSPLAREPEPASQPPSTSLEPEPEKTTRKSAGPVRTINVDVVARRDWTSTGLIVKRGDRIKIIASGSVVLDSGGKSSGPEGIPDLPDPKKLLPEHATGGLIGVIGADNDDFIFIGASAEFNATRDGLLFLSVNEGTLPDNSGTFRATIEHQAAKRPAQ
jgi:hypothetical protein